MKLIKEALCLAVLGLLVGCDRPADRTGTERESEITAAARERGVSDTNAAAAREADNTGRNVRDRSDATLTPGDQGGSEADREVTQRVRQALTGNDQLSTDAKNIKIITINGKVTLRGPVNSHQEREAIESAVQRLGITSVDNQLEVKETNK